MIATYRVIESLLHAGVLRIYGGEGSAKDAHGGASKTSPTSVTGGANHDYYFETGVGYWTGTFDFRVTDWRGFVTDSLGVVNRLLVLAMVVTIRLFGVARITSLLEGFPEEAPAGVVTNEVRLTTFGLTLYLLRERYCLHPDGRGVTVVSRERFGPVPFLFRSRKAHPAEVHDGGARATYYMPLLGTDWVGRYEVRADRNHIESVLTCPWGEATEVIDRVY
jgi:hypothetical protein